MGQASTTIERSPADVLRLVVAGTALVALLLLDSFAGASVVGFVYDLFRGLSSVNASFLTAVVSVVRIAAVVLLVAGLVVVITRGTGRALLTALAGGAAAVALDLVVDQFIDARQPALVALSDWVGPLTDHDFPSAQGLALAAGVVTAVAPWLPRRYRRLAWVLVFGLALSRFISAPTSGSSLAGLLSGWVAGTLALVVLGSPSSRPSRAAVIAGLRAVGAPLDTLDPAAVDARGSTPYFGATTDGRRLFVKVLGRDERSADLLFRLYRSVLPRNMGDERPFSSLRRAVEHEALVSLVATSVGAHTPPLVSVATAEPAGFVLAYEAVAGKSFDRLAPDDLTPTVLHEMWEQIAVLRRNGIAHRDLRLANLFLDGDGHAMLIDFGFAELAASDQLLGTDLAELLTAVSLAVGPDRAVAGAADTIGTEALSTALPWLSPQRLSGATRTALKARPGLLDDIHQAVLASGTVISLRAAADRTGRPGALPTS